MRIFCLYLPLNRSEEDSILITISTIVTLTISISITTLATTSIDNRKILHHKLVYVKYIV